jgi:hypothetical protein
MFDRQLASTLQLEFPGGVELVAQENRDDLLFRDQFTKLV